MTTLTWDRHRGHASAYDVVALGYNYRIDEPRAALGRARLARLDDENDKRRALDARYREMLGQVPGVVPTARADGRLQCACHLFTVVLDQAIDRDAVRAALAERGIQTSVHYPAAHHFSIYCDGAPELPLTDAYAARSMSLPMFADLTHSQQDLVVETLDQVLPVALSR
jgi:dTDP-4-amino-4,6-dideoxygalactose transaminase